MIRRGSAWALGGQHLLTESCRQLGEHRSYAVVTQSELLSDLDLSREGDDEEADYCVGHPGLCGRRGVCEAGPLQAASRRGAVPDRLIMVVEQPLDILAFEKTGRFKGLYHVLHGAINPLDNIGPDEIYINELFERLVNGEEGIVKEIIIATNPTMEGDATAMYISKKLKTKNLKLKTTRLGMGVPTGADLEYADETTLREAIDGRRPL